MTTPTFSRQAFEDVASFLPLFGASNFDFGTWVLRQGSFPFVTYHPEVGRFVLTLERHGWVHQSNDFLWGPWLRTPEAQHLISGETLGRATPEQLARLLTVFARQERLVDGARLEMYHSGLLVAILRRVHDYLHQVPWADETDAAPQPVPMLAASAGAAPGFRSGLSFSDAARRVHDFISQFEEGYFPPLLMLARLTEETGEIARVLAHQNGKKPKKGEEVGDLEMELADLLFVMLCLANERGLSLEQGFTRMMDKLERRDKDRWTRKPPLAPRKPPASPVAPPQAPEAEAVAPAVSTPHPHPAEPEPTPGPSEPEATAPGAARPASDPSEPPVPGAVDLAWEDVPPMDVLPADMPSGDAAEIGGVAENGGAEPVMPVPAPPATAPQPISLDFPSGPAQDGRAEETVAMPARDDAPEPDLDVVADAITALFSSSETQEKKPDTSGESKPARPTGPRKKGRK